MTAYAACDACGETRPEGPPRGGWGLLVVFGEKHDRIDLCPSCCDEVRGSLDPQAYVKARAEYEARKRKWGRR